MSEAHAVEAEHPRRMLDRYEVIAEIARGGMGTVLLARLEGAGGFERLMAVKLMHEHLAQDPQFITMLLDEARTAANIHHPNAVGIVDVAESAVGYYLVMSYVEGFTLAQLIEHPSLDAKRRIRLGLRVLIDACHGLHAAHTAKDAKGTPLSIVHRDVSPQNVLVGLDGVGRIVDFGIALAASRIASSRPGVLKGKPSYMAPEQVQSEACDGRADVFALGIVLWEILTGERLFQAEMELATLLQVVEAKVAPPSKKEPLITPELDAVTLAALKRAPSERTADARTLAVSLERAAEAAGLLAPAHEVADAIERLFADEIAQRQDAIRHHLATSSGEKKPLAPGQLGLIPRLYDRSPIPRSAEMENRSGVRERDSSVDPQAPTEHVSTPLRTVALPTPILERPAAEAAPAPTEPRRWLAPVIVVAALALVGVAVFFASSGPSDPSTEAPEAVEPPGDETPATVPETESARAGEAAEVVAPVEPAAEATAPAEAAAAPATPSEERVEQGGLLEAAGLGEAAELVEATGDEAAGLAGGLLGSEERRAERRQRREREEAPAESEAEESTPDQGPALESNPYIVH